MRTAVLFLALAAACDEGSITGTLLDASASDARAGGGDAGVADAAADDGDPGTPDAALPTGPVTVHVAMAGEPVEGATVVFHTAGGLTIDVEETDASGDAIQIVPAGAQVTTSFSLGEDYLFTVTGVEPGEEIWIEPSRIASGDAGTVSVSAQKTVKLATAYVAETCGDEHVLPAIRTPTAIPLPAGCVDGEGRFDLLVRALDDTGATIAYTHALDVAADAGGATVLAMPMPWSTDLAPASITITGAPPFATLAAASARAIRGGLPYAAGSVSAASPGGGMASFSIPVPGVFAERVSLSAAASDADVTAVFTRDVAPPGTLAVDGAADFLPAPAAIDVSDSGDGILVTWDDQAPAADMQVVLVRYAAGDGTRTWALVVAPGTHSATLPALPALFADLTPTLASIQTITVATVDTSLLDGYAAARTQRPAFLFPAFAAFVPGEQDYTIALTYRVATP